MTRKGLMVGLPKNQPDLEEPFHICLLTNETKITRGPTTDVSKFAPGFMLQTYFAFLNVEIIRGFTYNLEAIFSATSHPFGFPPRSKNPHLEIPIFLVTTLMNQFKKVELIRVDEDGTLKISYELMKTCHNMNTIVQTTGGYESSLNGKNEIPNKTLANIKRDLLLKSSNKKHIW